MNDSYLSAIFLYSTTFETKLESFIAKFNFKNDRTISNNVNLIVIGFE